MLKLTSQSLILEGENIAALRAEAEAAARELGRFIYIEHMDGQKYVDEVKRIYEYTRGVRREPFAVIIDADSIFRSPEAQNAFLKIFEEPNENIYLILLTTKAQKLLPTIRSRASLVSVKSTQSLDTTEARKWLDSSIYERLIAIAKIKKRDEAVEFVRNIAQPLPQLATENPKLVKSADIISTTLDNLIQNGNVKAQLTNLAINL
ncbi:MAG: hypothetical protein LBK50_03085 [Candidatus Nomurabacteria bacterium]|jgi:DNA polymerase III delta prime subunit|nr:hypothetical protein [Candidatus Nomurabacteria bacterium]